MLIPLISITVYGSHQSGATQFGIRRQTLLPHFLSNLYSYYPMPVILDVRRSLLVSRACSTHDVSDSSSSSLVLRTSYLGIGITHPQPFHFYALTGWLKLRREEEGASRASRGALDFPYMYPPFSFASPSSTLTWMFRSRGGSIPSARSTGTYMRLDSEGF